MRLKRAASAAVAAAISLSLFPAAITANAEDNAAIPADKTLTIKGWDGVAESGLDLADKQSGLSTYNQTNSSTGSGHDVNFGFISFTIPAGTETDKLRLHLTSAKGQYSTATSAYAAVADLSSTVVSGAAAPGTFDGITWANRPALGNTSAAVSYTTGGYSYTDNLNNDLYIPLRDTSGNAIITASASAQSVTLAVYFNGKSVRETFSAACNCG